METQVFLMVNLGMWSGKSDLCIEIMGTGVDLSREETCIMRLRWKCIVHHGPNQLSHTSVSHALPKEMLLHGL